VDELSQEALATVVAADLPLLIRHTDFVIENARAKLDEPLPFLGGIDWQLVAMRAASPVIAGVRCGNPNCQRDLQEVCDKHGDEKLGSVLESKLLCMPGTDLQMELCILCENEIWKQLQAREKTLRDLLEPTYQQLHRAKSLHPGEQELDARIRRMQKLAKKAKLRLRSGPGACFIATAAYGSPFAVEVAILRQFRDNVLYRSLAGRWFIKTYYFLAPPLAAILARTALGRALVRAMLVPIVNLCRRRPCSGSEI